MQKILRTNKSASGTSFFNQVVIASPNELKQAFGTPVWAGNDGSDKTNMEWELELEDGTVFTIYDWKEYRPLNLDFRYKWHIGSKSFEASYDAAMTVRHYLALKLKVEYGQIH